MTHVDSIPSRSAESESVRPEGTRFQPDPEVIRWRLHFRSAPTEVFRALSTGEGRKRFWAESADQVGDVIRFVVPGGHECEGRVLESVPDRRFVTEYFGWTVEFDLLPVGAAGGTDLEMTCRNMPAEDRAEITAGWVSALMSLKAWVDFGVDLRNHDPARTWWEGYAEN